MGDKKRQANKIQVGIDKPTSKDDLMPIAATTKVITNTSAVMIFPINSETNSTDMSVRSSVIMISIPSGKNFFASSTMLLTCRATTTSLASLFLKMVTATALSPLTFAIESLSLKVLLSLTKSSKVTTALLSSSMGIFPTSSKVSKTEGTET